MRRQYTKEEIDAWRKAHNSFIYFNRDDANLFVPKPYSAFGRTLNWAHPLSWLVLAAVAALIVYSVFL